LPEHWQVLERARGHNINNNNNNNNNNNASTIVLLSSLPPTSSLATPTAPPTRVRERREQSEREAISRNITLILEDLLRNYDKTERPAFSRGKNTMQLLEYNDFHCAKA
jgi:hypothetical protein